MQTTELVVLKSTQNRMDPTGSQDRSECAERESAEVERTCELQVSVHRKTILYFFLIDCKLSWLQSSFFLQAKIRIELRLPERDLFLYM